jgi:cytochrome c-type biogenesis protein CcmE
MKPRFIIGGVIVVIFIVIGAYSFLESNIQYMNFEKAKAAGKKVQVKGEWAKDKESRYDAAKNQFVFYMRDDNNMEVKVVLDGAKPNNFEVATSVVAKGRFEKDYFHASDVLTKCPSKYEGQGEDLKKTM